MLDGFRVLFVLALLATVFAAWEKEIE